MAKNDTAASAIEAAGTELLAHGEFGSTESSSTRNAYIAARAALEAALAPAPSSGEAEPVVWQSRRKWNDSWTSWANMAEDTALHLRSLNRADIEVRLLGARAALQAQAAASGAGETEVNYEVWQDDMPVASSTNLADAQHYAAVYSQDGPVKLVKVTTHRQHHYVLETIGL